MTTTESLPDPSWPRGFRDVALCGSGATSRVYRAVEEATGRAVALKRLHRQMVRSTEALTRLRRELQSLASLNHPGIVRVHDVIRWGGDPTIVMDYVPGEDVKEVVVHRGPVSPAFATGLARALLDILAATHAAGIVHRDVKPQNVRMNPEGHVYLLDFGSARLCAASELTTTGTTVGTPEYMAPELFAGSVYDPRVDLYGVGATLYECLTGKPPQVADSLANLAYLRTQVDIPSVAAARPDLPPALVYLVDRCLARAPEERFASASLAAWCLDHPEESRAFAARRSTHPLCLHCGTPIPAESARCARCRSTHPFVFAPGQSHVVVSRVSQPAKLVEWVVTRLPARARPDSLHALAERCAALSQGKQRLLSFVAEEEAQHVVQELTALGVGAEVERYQGAGVLGGLAAFAVVSVAAGPQAGLLAGLGVGILPSVLAVGLSEHGMLSRERAPLLWSSLTYLLGMLTGVTACTSLVARSVGLGAAALGLGAAWVAALAARFHKVPPTAVDCPEPAPWSKWMQALSRAQKRKKPASEVRRTGRLVYAFFTLVFVALVPLGIWGAGVVSQTLRWNHVVQQRGLDALLPAPDPPPAPEASGAGGGRGTGAPRPSTLRRLADRAQDVAWETWPLLPSAGVVAYLARRRRRLQVDGAAVYVELDLAQMKQLAARRAPLQRALALRPRAADGLIREEAGDAFTDEATTRAADLARCLPREGVQRLAEALETMQRGKAHHAQAERSLLARCILETDPEQQARFDFLALEGRMEMEAAQAWALRLKEKGL